MGNLVTKSSTSADYITSSTASTANYVDEQIEKKIHYPPIRPVEYFSRLNTSTSKFIVMQTTQNEKIPLLIVMPEGNKNPKKYIIFSHGNGSDLYSMFSYFKYWADICDVCVVGYDYIGYGVSSEHNPTEERCYQSMRYTVQYVMDQLRVDPSNIYLIGQSLGTGIVIDYASKTNWKNRIMVVSPYKTIGTVVADSSASCIKPVDKYCSIDKLPKVNCPVQILHGTADELINISHGKTLYENLKNKSLKAIWLEGIGHNDILDGSFVTYLQEFLC
jgi:pimeloyl-ACP methyl ester carboxylesterase